MTAFGLAGVIHVPLRIPQNIKFKIGRRTSVTLFEGLQTRFHDFPSGRQRAILLVMCGSRPAKVPVGFGSAKPRHGIGVMVIVATFKKSKPVCRVLGSGLSVLPTASDGVRTCFGEHV